MHKNASVLHKLSFLSLIVMPLPSLAAVPDGLGGTVKVDGSSTVYPITEAVAEEFGKLANNVKITVGISGTGGGMKKFCTGETDISNASRPIKPTEIEQCQKNGIDFIELPVAYDALSIVVNKANNWLTSITVQELKKLWEPEAQGVVMTWDQVRSTWPKQPVRLFGAGVDSGTYDYFTEAIVGKEDASRGDYTSSEDDNMLVKGVESNKYALGFFGLAYFEENKTRLNAVAVDDQKDSNGVGPQLPSAANVETGSYAPLSRPLFIYVSKQAVARPEVAAFINFYQQQATTLSKEVGYIALPANINALAVERFAKRSTGTLFAAGNQVGVSLESLMRKANNG